MNRQIKPLQNAGTADATGEVECKQCHYIGDIDTFAPAVSVYQDICCPQCNSTWNDHNSAYQDRLFAKMRGDE